MTISQSVTAPEISRTAVNPTGSAAPEPSAIRASTELAANATKVQTVRLAVRVAD